MSAQAETARPRLFYDWIIVLFSALTQAVGVGQAYLRYKVREALRPMRAHVSSPGGPFLASSVAARLVTGHLYRRSPPAPP